MLPDSHRRRNVYDNFVITATGGTHCSGTEPLEAFLYLNCIGTRSRSLQSSFISPSLFPSSQPILTMKDQTPPRRRLPDVKFRVLIAGRANAGKTSILQRVCDTTESPTAYRVSVDEDGDETREEIRLDPTSERGEHEISHELEFSNHKGYVFHDSRGLESGTADELQIIRDFVGDRSRRKRLEERLHAIWYCIPMDGNRSSLDIEPFHNICPDKNVPVIAVFTKFETFIHSTRSDMMLKRQKGNLKDECEKRFEELYSDKLGVGAKFVRLQGMEKPDARCDELVKTTMETLDTATVALMLLAVQTENLGLNVQYVVSRECCKKVSRGKQAGMRLYKAAWWDFQCYGWVLPG
ncbi:GTP-binding protein [Mycena venus]|uniref:GTP-binding protein n=1 Tax=Mycena venus TaxID=2733690 RepID=A0A8H6Z671_9AGAR|nr:GTP-binding protein [Mycena venus]